MKHKHAEYIKQWVDGVECELWYIEEKRWIDVKYLGDFDLYYDVRIKPEPKPDVVDYLFISDKKSNDLPEINWVFVNTANLKLVWDGETGKLKDAEVIE